MNKKSILLILVDRRKDAAEKVQKILTGWGCIIKLRLGIHDGVLDDCTEHGLMMLELVGSTEQRQELSRKLDLLDGVTTNLVEMGFEE